MVLPNWDDLTTDEKLNARYRYERIKEEFNNFLESNKPKKTTRKRATKKEDE